MVEFSFVAEETYVL